ncbi:uncharacterized protein LOC120338452 [Styela clava]
MHGAMLRWCILCLLTVAGESVKISNIIDWSKMNGVWFSAFFSTTTIWENVWKCHVFSPIEVTGTQLKSGSFYNFPANDSKAASSIVEDLGVDSSNRFYAHPHMRGAWNKLDSSLQSDPISSDNSKTELQWFNTHPHICWTDYATFFGCSTIFLDGTYTMEIWARTPTITSKQIEFFKRFSAANNVDTRSMKTYRCGEVEPRDFMK